MLIALEDLGVVAVLLLMRLRLVRSNGGKVRCGVRVEKILTLFGERCSLLMERSLKHDSPAACDPKRVFVEWVGVPRKPEKWLTNGDSSRFLKVTNQKSMQF